MIEKIYSKIDGKLLHIVNRFDYIKIVIKGSVKCKFYDTDNTLIAEPILMPGDASFTLYGGHTYEILEEGTIVYEYKTGPYEGQELDKELL